ncbi:DUF6266 family protein [Parapedobacter koreensis]|uniref:Uncharacterized protein n=1 Tax=Parapedobacter koreensis TaxID=332977 RepID=A0A1H7MG26_9SPHI|nr:DUF6266 family protein [Parapedobacter koreensis]SEL09645.1 hypothetical protein SAMN05421740_103485 [Parapedobacter koreensis]
MAKMIDLFTFSGRLGDMVGCMGPSGFYVRSRPRKSTKPPTIRQLETRARMALVAKFLNPIRELISLGFASQQDRRSKAGAFGRATAHALRKAVAGTYPDLSIDPGEVLLSRGGLAGLGKPALAVAEPSLTVTWVPYTDRMRAFADDTVYAVAYHADAGALATGIATRGSGTVNIDISGERAGSELLVYVCVAERDHREFSNSQFLGIAYT